MLCPVSALNTWHKYGPDKLTWAARPQWKPDPNNASPDRAALLSLLPVRQAAQETSQWIGDFLGKLPDRFHQLYVRIRRFHLLKPRLLIPGMTDSELLRVGHAPYAPTQSPFQHAGMDMPFGCSLTSLIALSVHRSIAPLFGFRRLSRSLASATRNSSSSSIVAKRFEIPPILGCE